MEKKIAELKTILESINGLRETNPEYFTEVDGEVYFQNSDHHLESELDIWASNEFISGTGGYTYAWYKMKPACKNEGIRLFTGEQDSFGPLTSCIAYKGWIFVFG